MSVNEWEHIRNLIEQKLLAKNADLEDIDYVIGDSHIKEAIEFLRTDGDFDVLYTPPTGDRIEPPELYGILEMGGTPSMASPKILERGFIYWEEEGPKLEIIKKRPTHKPDEGISEE